MALWIRKTHGLTLLALVCVAAATWAAPTEPGLTEEQAAIARRVEAQLMAPCCFGGTIATHHSPLADQFRREIRSRAAQGASESQILDYYLEVYGERILAQPVARGFNLLAYWMPVAGLLCGAVVVWLWLLRRHVPVATDHTTERVPNQPPAAMRRLVDQLNEELAAFDG